MAELKDYILEHFIKGKDVVYIGKELVRCKDCEHFTDDYKDLGSRCVAWYAYAFKRLLLPCRTQS